MKSVVNLGRPTQIAYVVPDLEAAVHHQNKLFGTGPFFELEMDADCFYRGSTTKLRQKFVLSQWGDLQLELIQLLDDSPSIFRELPASTSGQPIFHHVCFLPEKLDETISSLSEEGYPVVLELTTPVGSRIAMVDAREHHGHFIELHERLPQVEMLYANIGRASETFDGERLIRPFGEAFA